VYFAAQPAISLGLSRFAVPPLTRLATLGRSHHCGQGLADGASGSNALIANDARYDAASATSEWLILIALIALIAAAIRLQ
jgi:hypothetical protein